MTKYSAIKTVCASGHRHDSKMEAKRCDQLTALEASGEITHLVQQPEFRVEINGKLICRYIADFQYRMADSGLLIVCDVKGMKTPMFNLKRKLVEASYPGIVISLYPPEKPKRRKAKAKVKKAEPNFDGRDTVYDPRRHPADCSYHVDQYLTECTCGIAPEALAV